MRTTAFGTALLLCSLQPLLAESLTCAFSPAHTPAAGADSRLWGELEPVDTGDLPAGRDTTAFDQLSDFEPHPYWMSLDVEGGWIFAAANRRLQIWDAGTSSGAPVRIFDRGFRDLGLTWTPDAHAFLIFEDIDAPPGSPEVLALTGRYGVGLALYDATSKSSPRLLYQDHGNGRWGRAVWATSIGGRHYAVLGAHQNAAGGAYLYDLSAARGYSNCREAQPGTTFCPGVFLGRLGSRARVVAVDGEGPFVALSSGTSPGGFEIWDLATPTLPRRRLEGLASEPVFALALWEEAGAYFLAARTASEVRVYDVSCISSGACFLGAPISTLAAPTAATGTLTFSRTDEGTPFLYSGRTDDCLAGLQQEWLWDVSNPASPRDVTPPQTPVIFGERIAYWGWYYRNNGVHGFNHVAPRMGKFYGNHFYRAGLAIFDVHRLNAAPVPEILGLDVVPASPVVCQEVTFSTEGVLGEPPLSYAWTLRAPGGQIAATATAESWSWSTLASSTPGTYGLELRVDNAHGFDVAARAFELSPPPPLEFTGPGGAPTADPPQGGDVQFHLEEQGAAEWLWDFGDGSSVRYTDAGSGRAPQHRYSEAGTYQVRVTIRNCLEPAGLISAALSVRIQAVSLEILEFQAAGGAACNSTLCAVQTLVPVSFSQAFAGGPTHFAYDWDGDGSIDQVAGDPVDRYTFLAPGAYRPRLSVSRGSQSVAADHPVVIVANGGTGAPPAAPAGLSADEIAGTSLRLSWVDRATNEESYRVDERQGASWSQRAFLEANRRQAIVDGLAPETTYVFRVRAVNHLGEAASPPVQVTTAGGGGGGDVLFSDGFETGFRPWSRATLFCDGFESGSTSSWSGALGDLGAERRPR